MCVRVQWGGGGALFVAEIRYRHDLVRLCRKFHFCPFQMKMPHIDEEQEMYALPIQGSVQDFLFGGGSRSQKNIWSHAAARKFF